MNSSRSNQQQQQQQQMATYQIPTKPYFMADSHRPIEEICDVTDYLSYLSTEFTAYMLKSIIDHQRKPTLEFQPSVSISVYGEFKAPPSVAVIQKVNGKGGYFLKETTINTGVYFIWHNVKDNVYMFWGPSKFKVADAMNRIRSRIIKYVVHVPQEEQQQEQERPLPTSRASTPRTSTTRALPPWPVQVPRSNAHSLASTPPPFEGTRRPLQRNPSIRSTSFGRQQQYQQQQHEQQQHEQQQHEQQQHEQQQHEQSLEDLLIVRTFGEAPRGGQESDTNEVGANKVEADEYAGMPPLIPANNNNGVYNDLPELVPITDDEEVEDEECGRSYSRAWSKCSILRGNKR